MNIKRIILGIIFGVVAGILCVFGNILLTPSWTGNEGFLVIAFWNRVILGLLIGFAGDLKLVQSETAPLNAIIRGAIFGAIVSLHLAFFSNVFSFLFFLMGIVFGAAIDLLGTLASKNAS
ncbi:MAG: hypothetical protein ACFFDI_26230 [Promethearchaeota archaeon]